MYRDIVEPDIVLDRKVRGHPVKYHAENKALIDYYYTLALYCYRRGDSFIAGICLGRAMHYIHDGALVYHKEADHKRIEYEMKSLIRNSDIQTICSTASTTWRYTVAETALCEGYRKSINLLRSFIEEVRRPIDIEGIRKRYKRVKTLKILVTLTLFILTLLSSATSLATAVILEKALLCAILLHVFSTFIATLLTLHMAGKTGRLRLRHVIPMIIASLIPPHTLALFSLTLLIASYRPEIYIDAMKAGVAKTLDVPDVKTAY